MKPLSHLLGLAEKASPGPWRFDTIPGEQRTDDSGWGAEGLWTPDNKMVLGTADGWEGGYRGPSDADAAFIASANPRVVAALVREVVAALVREVMARRKDAQVQWEIRRDYPDLDYGPDVSQENLDAALQVSVAMDALDEVLK